MVIADLFRAEVLEHFIEGFAVVAERHRAVVRKAVFDQHMAVKSPHFLYCEHADPAETLGCYRQYFTLRQ